MRRRSFKHFASLAGLFAVVCLVAGLAQDTAEPEVLGPFYATPRDVVEKMLELGELKPGELHYDLGSGDGRIVITAAQRFGARSVGFEILPELVKKSRAEIEALGLSQKARIEARDLLTADFSKPDLITVYLLPVGNDRLRPLLEAQMKKGSRLVAHYFPFEGWEPEKSVKYAGGPEGKGPLYPLYLYRR